MHDRMNIQQIVGIAGNEVTIARVGLFLHEI
jgi:uncharacterized protein YqfA (UPF0365 family)